MSNYAAADINQGPGLKGRATHNTYKSRDATLPPLKGFSVSYILQLLHYDFQSSGMHQNSYSSGLDLASRI